MVNACAIKTSLMYLNKSKIRRNSILHKISRSHFQIFSTMSLTNKYIVSCFLLLTIFTSVQSCGPGRGIGSGRRSRKLVPLVFKQHVPNMSENSLGASGLEEGRINRNNSKFKDLIPNYNRDIVFKDEEGTGADRLMTQRCKEKLNILAVSVMNNWPGVKLRVAESWDEDNAHGDNSLHYEGRAVDITTSDHDRSKYGMLARLAVEAGFDWVFYASRAHIHCSVKPDSEHTSHMSGCFTDDSTVQTSTGEKRKMSELNLGEKVLSMSNDGSIVYSEVIMFLDRNIEQSHKFVRILTDGGATLTVTPAHLIMAWNPKKNLKDFIFADKIEEGDFVLVNIKETLEPRKVIQLSAVLSKGIIAPLTKEGTIIVDSIVASCYALVNSQSIAHWSFMPWRAVENVRHWFSIKTNRSALRKYSTNQNGIHWYARSLYSIKDYILPIDWIYH